MATKKHKIGDWVETNPNPMEYLQSDCVIRSFALANDMTWQEAQLQLYTASIEKMRVYDDKDFLKLYFNEMGYKKLSFPAKKGQKRMTPKDFCKKYPQGSYILDMAGHESCVKDGLILDTWNCSDKCVYTAWQVK